MVTGGGEVLKMGLFIKMPHASCLLREDDVTATEISLEGNANGNY